MAAKLFTIDATNRSAYPAATSPDVDLTGDAGFEPIEWIVRADKDNAAEVLLSWDGATDMLRIALPADRGTIPLVFRARGRKLWATAVTQGGAAAKVYVTAKTEN